MFAVASGISLILTSFLNGLLLDRFLFGLLLGRFLLRFFLSANNLFGLGLADRNLRREDLWLDRFSLLFHERLIDDHVIWRKG